ncbi:hypothetical protein BASA50_006090 [Batrachochytrium salamandrivorans]|uniref:type I protein arginine methyltransferase n=1 Tax=Batrachochytrium salamandrivorans TaxID=1357716 RepID=A0ABQ8FDS8_9FUNG|nr:hypothetical protein BASA62_003942 [Batrachochytrium salamandrivorans]KAH6595104.1 hypothetical protein BASA50_006090 [Batrachochytrium salamandrivorans]KAH9274353.1 hypothetical protein BASA83_003351 [Batrachochytrium salamandrivorans]
MEAQKSSTSTDSRDTTYFSYYAQFVHQQNMLEDTVRTSLYQTAILSNGPTLFDGKMVMDLGAGSGILSFLAIRAGANHVIAVEASGMADKIQKLIDYTHTTNHWLHGKLTVVKNKIEDVESLPMVDTLISEPIGVLLVHERMLESYILARDRFLKPDGVMVPSMGTIYVAPISDSNLWSQTMSKVRFWEQQEFFGVDLSPLAQDAKDEIFGQPVVGGFDARSLVAPACSHNVDFRTVTAAELKDIVIPFTFMATYTGLIHGIGAWFDINLAGYVLSTAPHAEKTHWHQVRLLLKEPLAINAFETIRGWLRMVANPMRSYDITAELIVGNQGLLSNPQVPFIASTRAIPEGFSRRTGKWALHEQTYYFDQYPTDATARPEINQLHLFVIQTKKKHSMLPLQQSQTRLSLYEQLRMADNPSLPSSAACASTAPSQAASPHMHFVSRDPAGAPFRPYKYALRCQGNPGSTALETDSSLAKGRMPQFRAERTRANLESMAGTSTAMSMHTSDINESSKLSKPSSNPSKHPIQPFGQTFAEEDSYLLYRSTDMGASIFDIQATLTHL